MKKLQVLVGLSMIGALMFASVASAQCVPSSSASGSASASGCNDFGVVSASSSSVTATVSTPGLPGTGGLSPTSALWPLALIVGSGLLAFRVVRRR